MLNRNKIEWLRVVTATLEKSVLHPDTREAFQARPWGTAQDSQWLEPGLRVDHVEARREPGSRSSTCTPSTFDFPAQPQPASEERLQGHPGTANMGFCLLTWLSSKVSF